MEENAKAAIVEAAVLMGQSDSYGALLYLAASLEFDPKALVPESEAEKDTWRGHLLGMRSALHCLVMREQKCGPESAGVVVDQHIIQAVGVMRRFAAESGG